MRIYFAGIGGVGLGPLAEIASDADYTVLGSDANESLITKQLQGRGVTVSHDQSGSFLLESQEDEPIDWFVYTSSLPDDHPELVMARDIGIPHITKRDELIKHITDEKNLQMIAIAGTHGKTTTTSMFVWVCQQLNIPISYSVGTTLSFASSGKYNPDSQYFIYECDEFDRNFLTFTPFLSLITSLDYDHPDTYPTKESYDQAFNTFIDQSDHVIMRNDDLSDNINQPESAWLLNDQETTDITLIGAHNRANASLVTKAFEYLNIADDSAVMSAINSFPGSNRRFEKLADNLYTDYGHHPKEISATLQLASELSPNITLVYQPHQNLRQHQVKDDYTDCMKLAKNIYWLPTYLTRENPDLTILSPETLTANLVNHDAVIYAELDDELWQNIQEARDSGNLVLCMGAGTIDAWIRSHL